MKAPHPTEEEVAFGRRVEAMMRARGVSISAVAKELGVSESNIRKIWTGGACRQYLQLSVLAGALGVSPNVLLGVRSSDLDKRSILSAFQGVIEYMGFERSVARHAARIALEAASMQRVLDEPDEAEVRASAKLLMRQAERTE